MDRNSPRSCHWIGVEDGWQERRELPRRVGLPITDLKNHALVIGATGSGKTNLLHHLIAQDIRFGHSFCVLDLHGDMADASLDLLAGHIPVSKTFLLDLHEQHFPSGFDVFGGKGEPYYRALGLLKAVRDESAQWGPLIDDSMRNGFMLLAEVKEPITKLEALFSDPSFLRNCLDRAKPSPTVDFWLRYLEMSREKRDAFANPIRNKVSPLLATATLRNILSHPRPLDLKQHLDTRGSALLISLVVQELHASGRMMGRIVLASLLREIFSRAGTPERARNPVHLFVDEFENFGTENFEEILAEARKFRLGLILAHQNTSQLPPKLRATVLGNVGAKVVFRCGREDAQLLSRDLTGDPKALDLANLKTGHAILWTREGGVTPIEVNAPIVQNLGARSPRARALVRALQKRWGASPSEFPSEDRASRPRVTTKTEEQPRQQKPKTSMEDWICGN